MKVAIYIRVSTEEQAKKGYSLADQRELCVKRAKELGATKIVEFIDDGVSGELLDFRPGLTRLREKAREQGFDMLLCKDPDRLSRVLAHQLLITEELEKKNIKIEFIDFEWKNSPEGRLFYAIRGAVAEFEKEKIRQRTVSGKLRKAREGKIPAGPAPYGYRVENSKLVIHPAEAEVVKKMFKWFTDEDIGINGLVEKLRAHSIPTRKGLPVWQRATVSKILRDTVYVGKYVYNRRDCKNKHHNRYLPKGQKVKVKEKPPEDWIYIDVPPVIDEELFELVQEKLSYLRRRWAGWSKYKYLLSGLIVCEDCGNNMHGAIHHKQRTYTCNNNTADSKNIGCRPVKRIDASTVELKIWETVTCWLSDPEAIVQELMARQNNFEEIEKELAQVDKKIASLEKGRINMLNMISSGVVDVTPGTKKILLEHKEELNKLRAQQRKLQEKINTEGLHFTKFYALAEKMVKSDIKSLTFDEKRAIIRALINCIYVKGKNSNLKIKIEVSFAQSLPINVKGKKAKNS